MKKDFDTQFKDMIKNIIKEENYFKEEDIKKLAQNILKEIDPLIAKHIKEHFREIANLMFTNFQSTSSDQEKIEREEDAKTS